MFNYFSIITHQKCYLSHVVKKYIIAQVYLKYVINAQPCNFIGKLFIFFFEKRIEFVNIYSCIGEIIT